MTTSSSISSLFVIHLVFTISLAVKAQDLEGLSSPHISRIDDYESLVQEKHAGKSNITMSPVKLFRGDTGTVTCNFEGVTNVFWSHNSTNISDNSKYTTKSSKQGSMYVYELRIEDLEYSDTGTYTCSGTINKNGISQSLKTVISIYEIDIKASSNVETFCDGSTWNISCCSEDIDFFNVKWEPKDAPGKKSSNRTCNIYTLTADITQCSSPQPKTYTCTLQTNNGAKASKVITINYITKASIDIRAVSPISAGKALNITCTTNVNVKEIMLAKDTTSNVKASASNTNSVLLPIPYTTGDWSGIFICTAYQSSLSSSQNITVEVVPLPRSEAIQVYPLQSYKKCGDQAVLKCCVVDQNYTIYFSNNTAVTPGTPSGNLGNMKCFAYNQSVGCTLDAVSSVQCIVANKLSEHATSRDSMTISRLAGKTCSAVNMRPATPSGSNYSMPCQTLDPSQLGNIIYPCGTDGIWEKEINQCFSVKIFLELQNVMDFVNGPDVEQNFPLVLENIMNVAKDERENIAKSSKNIEYMVDIISMAASKNIAIDQPMMENVLRTVDIVLSTVTSWGTASNQSSTVLKSMETFANNLQFHDSISINNDNIQLFGKVVTSNSKYDANFSMGNLSGSVMIDSGSMPGDSNTVVTIAYSTIKNLLPDFHTNKVNALVMLTVVSNFSHTNSDAFNITMTFAKSDSSLMNPDCMWLDLDTQYWSTIGCIALDAGDDMVKCSCDHLTSFSVLMGGEYALGMSIVKNICFGIPIGCLVITLVCETLLWRSVIKTKISYMRYVCQVNIAVTLLITNIWFIIIGTQLADRKPNESITVDFFPFYVYLSLFFWMLALGLLLFYRFIFVLHDMSRRIMMIIAFTVGYGCPLLIAIISVASTALSGGFTIGESYWLWPSGAIPFLAFVVPPLITVLINFIILIVVIIKLLTPETGELVGQEKRRHLVMIAKSIPVLTPPFGTSSGFFLLASITPLNPVYNGIFSLLNYFQGLFFFISTVLLERKVRTALRSSIFTLYYILHTRVKRYIFKATKE